MPVPLDGVNVLEVNNWVAAPSTPATLADLGAKVIKIEPPDTGDRMRSITTSTQGVVPHTGGINVAIEQDNRGKKSVTVNLDHPSGMESWGQRLDTEGRIWAPVQTLDEVAIGPQVQANKYLITLRHSTEGSFQIVATPMKFDRTPAQMKGPAPEIGQHSELALLDLGNTWDGILTLREQGAIIYPG